MKHALLCCLLVVSSGLSAQNSYWKFTATGFEKEGAVSGVLEAWISGKRYCTLESTTGNTYTCIVDSVAGKGLLLEDEGPEKKLALLYSLNDETMNETAEREPEETDEEWYDPDLVEGEDYRFVAGTKTIKGFPCRKLEFIDDNLASGIGWMAIGVHLDLYASEEFNFLNLAKGTILELDMVDVDGGTSQLQLTEYSTKPVFPKGIFSLTIPEGYKDNTNHARLRQLEEEEE